MGEAAVAVPMVASAGMNYLGGREESAARQGANNLTYQQALMNQELQQDRDAENLMLTTSMNAEEKLYRDKLLRMITEGYSDTATGTTSKYVSGEGWRTTYTPEATDLINADRSEQLNRIIVDQAMARRGRQSNELRRMDEGAAASKTLGEMESPDPYDSKRIVADLIAARRRGVNEGFDKSLKGAITSDIRSGTNSNRLIAEMARERGSALSDAEAGAYTEGLGLSEDLRGSRTSRLGNKYNMLAGRASNFDDVQFAPQSLSSNAQNAAFARNPSSAGTPVMVNPRGNPSAATFDHSVIKPNFQGADNKYAIGALFDRLGGGYNEYSGRTRKTTTN